MSVLVHFAQLNTTFSVTVVSKYV